MKAKLSWIVPILFIFIAGGTAFLWLPPLAQWIAPNSDQIQGTEALVSIVSILVSGILGWFKLFQKNAPAAAAPTHGEGAYVDGNVNTGGRNFVGRDEVVFGGSNSVVIGGNVSGSNILTGSGNILRDYDIQISGSTINLAADRVLGTSGKPEKLSDLREATRRYFKYLIERYRYLETRGFAVHDRMTMKFPLLNLYVPLLARVNTPSSQSSYGTMMLAGREFSDSAGERVHTNTLPVIDLLREHSGLIVLGDPGSGKTTFLKFLTLRLAIGEGEALGIGERLPILIPISAYANAIEKARGGLRLDTFICDYYNTVSSTLPIDEMLSTALEQGKALILLDGLDEIASDVLRSRVMKRVVDFYSFYKESGNKFVITSRIIGYSQVRPAVEDLVECTLTDFDDEQIRLFLEHWTLTLEKQVVGETELAQQNAVREKQELLNAIHRNTSLRTLAANPLLLTILALIKRQGVALPERRVELYDKALDTLLSTWNRARSLTGESVSGRDINPRDTIKLLAPLALWMHTVNPGVGLVKKRDLETQLRVYFSEQGEPVDEAVENFMKDVNEYTGVLLERGPGEYGFIHLTFEEYLSAIAIAQHGQLDWNNIASELGKLVENPVWREVVLLCIGYIGLIEGRDQVAGNIVEFLLKENPGGTGEAIILGGEAVLDNQPRGVPKRTREITIEHLVQTMQGREIGPDRRRRAGLILGRLGWTPDDLHAFVEVSKGRFIFGSQEEPGGEIPHNFFIAKYPVTNSQFAEFINAGGYRTQKYWSDEGWAWKVSAEKTQPVLWDNSDFNNPIFPAVGVSWYEAEAYAAWLNEQLKDAGKLPEGYIARLPTEEEWERAARGTDGREYPWESDFHESYANTGEPDIIGTTAVCTYPQGISPTGAWDMSGNVFEWTRSKEGSAYVLRGGSWGGSGRSAHCAARLRRGPGDFFSSIGLRLILSPGFSESGS